MDKELSVKKGFFSSLDRLASLFLLLGVFLTPILSLSFLGFSSEVLKKLFLAGLVVLVLAIWFLARFKEKKVFFVKSLALALAGTFLLVAFISSLLSGSISTSLVGLGFESGTFFSLLIFFALMFLVTEYTHVNFKRNILNVYLGLALIFLVAFLFQVSRLIFGDFLPFNILDSNGVFNGAINLIGKWNDFGILAGFMALSSLILMDLFPIKENRFLKNFVWVILISAILTLILVNFTLIWIILAIILFFVYAYNFSFLSKQQSGGHKVMKISLVVFLISLTFIIFGRPATFDVQGNLHEGFLTTQTRKISEKLKISSVEVRPSVNGTYALIKSGLKINPVLGNGLNTFSALWLKNKPTGVNDGPYWNIEPSFGVGFIPTFFATTGLLGGLSLVLFILFLVYLGFKALLSLKIDYLEKSFLLLSFSSLLYMWAFLFAYVPDTSILTIAFAVTGLFIACLIDLGEIKTIELTPSENPKIKFGSLILSALVFVLFVAMTVVWITTLGAMVAFQRSTVALGLNGDTVKAEKYINMAIQLNPQDVYYRMAMQVNVAEMTALLNKKDIPKEELSAAYPKVFEKAQRNIDAAVLANDQNYLNYATRGLLYENMVPQGVSGAYDKIKENYNSALTHNPYGPDMYLNLARLEITSKNYTEAETYLEKSLALKKNYIDAIFLQSQLYAQRGFLDSAIKRAGDASQLAPSDISILFQLGYLKYRNADYRGAMETLKSAIALVPSFANAQYFLGLSYDKLGSTDLAIKEFEEIEKSNPDNAELKQILVNLKAGRDALANTEPVDKKMTPPVKED